MRPPSKRSREERASRFLTPKQKRVLDFIGEYQALQGFAPTQHEIARRFGYRSLGTVQNFLVRLERHGHLRKHWNGRRAIEVRRIFPRHNHDAGPARAGPALIELPLLGRVAAGRPIEAIENRETIEVPSSMVPERKGGSGYFALRVSGDSMIEDGILDGDCVVVRKQETAENGETVVALIDEEATIKRLKRGEDGGIELHPANPAYRPILVDPRRRFRIEGVFAGLLRKARA